VTEERVVLEDEADAAIAGAALRGVLSRQQDRPRVTEAT
jgi:hypothetical protein